MIHSLFGILKSLGSNFFVIMCGGIGFKCKSDSRTLTSLTKNLNSEIEVFTFLNVRENSIDLFGFENLDSIECFKLLTGVSGVGPKASLSILSQFSPNEIFSIIHSERISSLTEVSGIGPKMASRIILELKGKFSKKVSFSNHRLNHISNNKKTNAVKALSVLGYSEHEVLPVLNKFDDSLSVEDLIKKTLKSFGG